MPSMNLENHAEGTQDVFFRGYPVSFFHIAAPAVNTAYTPHGAVDPYHAPARQRQFIGMVGLCQGAPEGQLQKRLLQYLEQARKKISQPRVYRFCPAHPWLVWGILQQEAPTAI